MSKSVHALMQGTRITIEQALKARQDAGTARLEAPEFTCTECRELVDAHKEGPGSPARFEHRTRNPACSLSHKARNSARQHQVENCITTLELEERTAGGDSYIRTKNGVVLGLALTQKLNARAPEIVVVGKGPQIEARARLFRDSCLAVPTYLKRATNAWELIGEYRVQAYKTDSATIGLYRDSRPRNEVAGILFLERVDEVVDISMRGGGFASPETRKEIEMAAINFVSEHYKHLGYEVHDRQLNNLGYDLLAVNPFETLKLEVKGTDAAMPRFFISRNEFKCALKDPAWLLAVVSTARKSPILKLMTITEVQKTYSMDPMAWECLPHA